MLPNGHTKLIREKINDKRMSGSISLERADDDETVMMI